MQPNLLRNLCFLPTKIKKYRTFYRTHFLLISITCLSRYISLSFYRPALLWCGMSDRCIKALESSLWYGSETCWYKHNTSIDSSGCDQLRFPCLSRDAPQTCAEQSASERDHSFLCTTSFNTNKHDWTSHASCNWPISVSTMKRCQQNSVEIKCHLEFHLPQSSVSTAR